MSSSDSETNSSNPSKSSPPPHSDTDDVGVAPTENVGVIDTTDHNASPIVEHDFATMFESEDFVSVGQPGTVDTTSVTPQHPTVVPWRQYKSKSVISSSDEEEDDTSMKVDPPKNPLLSRIVDQIQQ